MTHKTHQLPKLDSPEDRLLQGLTLVLSALPELLFQWLANRNK